MKNGCVGEQFRHVRVKSEARMSKPETIPNDKSRLNTVSVLLGTVSLIWILILALVSDFGIRISNFIPRPVKCGYTSASASNSAMCFGWRFVRSVI